MTKQYFELAETFWEVWVDGTDLYTRHGKIGSNGQVKIKNFSSAADAKAHQTKVIADKEKQGYGKPNGKAKSTAKGKGKGKAAEVAPTQHGAAPAAIEVPEGTLRLEYVDGKSRKFWQIRRDDKTVTVQFGKIGTDGQTQIKKHKDEWQARIDHDKQLADKKKKGYQIVVTGKLAAPSPVATDAGLEKAIVGNPDSDDGFMVYADFLQQHGDVRGELAVLQAQLAQSPKDKKLRNAEQKLLWEHRVHFYGALAPYVTKKQTKESAIEATWRQGWIDSLVLGASNDWSSSGAATVDNVAELIRLLPNVASAKFMRELVISRAVSDSEYNFATAIKELVKILPSLPMLKRLTVGRFGYEDSELSWSHAGSFEAFWPAAKQLEYLKIRAGSMQLGKIDAPNLRELRIETGGLDKKNVAALVTAKLPKLETLNVWFGQTHYGFNAKLADLLPFLDKKTFPKLKHLGVANTIFGDELAERWPTATILPQLQTLDISKSHLTVKGIRKMAAHKDAFAHLDSLDVSDCLIDKEGVKLAKTLCKNVNVKDQDRLEDYRDEDGDGDLFWRYSSVGE